MNWQTRSLQSKAGKKAVGQVYPVQTSQTQYRQKLTSLKVHNPYKSDIISLQ